MAKDHWTPDEGVDLVSAAGNTAYKTVHGAGNALVVGGVLIFAVAIIFGACVTPFAILFVMFTPPNIIWDGWARPQKYDEVPFAKLKMSRKRFDKKFGSFIFNARCKTIAWLILIWIVSAAIYWIAIKPDCR